MKIRILIKSILTVGIFLLAFLPSIESYASTIYYPPVTVPPNDNPNVPDSRIGAGTYDGSDYNAFQSQYLAWEKDNPDPDLDAAYQAVHDTNDTYIRDENGQFMYDSQSRIMIDPAKQAASDAAVAAYQALLTQKTNTALQETAYQQWLASGKSDQDLMDALNNGDPIDWIQLGKDGLGNPGWWNYQAPTDPNASDLNLGTGDINNVSGANNPSSSFIDTSVLLSNLKSQIPLLIRFVIALSYLFGIILVVIGVMKLKAYGHQTVMSSSHASMTSPMVHIIIGIILLFYPSTVHIVTNSLMSNGGDSVFSYSNGLPGLGYGEMYAVVIGIVRLVGYIAFLKGWLILVKLGSHHAQSGMMSKALVHIIGGIFAANIVTTWSILSATLGYAF